MSELLLLALAALLVAPGESPRAKLDAALAARKDASETVELRFAAGTHELAEPLRLGPKDAGVRVTAEKGARLTRSVACANGAKLEGAFPQPPNCEFFGAIEAHAPLFFYDHTWAVEARWPNEGWAVFTNVVHSGVKGEVPNGMPALEIPEAGSFIVDSDRPARWNFAEGAWLCGYFTHDWAFERVRAGSFNPKNRELWTAGPTQYGLGGQSWSDFGGRRFYACGIRSELDMPGEYFFDWKTSEVSFIAPKGLTEFRVVTKPGPVVELKGAKDVVLSGLDLEYALGDGIAMTDCQDVAVEDCRIRNMGGAGVTVEGGARCRVRRCTIDGLGTHGAVLTGGDRRRLVPAEHALENCTITRYGRIRHTYGVGVQVNGCGNRVVGCRISDAPHTAVNYRGNDHLLADNEVFDILRECSDAGAFYTGRDPTSRGNVLRNNYVHDIGRRGKGAGTMAFYLDDCDAGDTLVSNRIVNVARGLMIGGGQDNHVVGNVFRDCDIGLSVDARAFVWATNHWDNPKMPSWQMTRKVKEMHVDEEPWRSRYPLLVNYLNDAPREPRHISIVGNVFEKCTTPILWQWPAENFKSKMDIRDNKMLPQGAFAELGPEEYRPLRRELRAFHPDECHDKCRSAEVLASHEKMRAEVRRYAEANPDYDALDLRREYYGALVRNFRPVLFRESPFYFEAGINGGWVQRYNPARVVNELCGKFYRTQSLIPDSAFARARARWSQRYSLCCGPFVDDMHQLPPFRTVFTKGFKGVRDEVAAALRTCPADDPLGRKELETALVGLDAVHEIQLAFHEEAKKQLATIDGAAGVRALPESNNQTTEQSNNLRRIVEASQRCPWEPPRNFYEGLNTLWFVREILALVDGTDNFSIGRGDAWLIDFYRRDLKDGTLTEPEARDLVRRFMIHAECHQDGLVPVSAYSDHEAEIPLTLGGCDAAGQSVCNELTMMFLEEHQKMDLVFPKLHVRFSSKSPKTYLEKIAAQVLEGHAVFALFNDEAAIPVFVKMGYPLERARDYVCTGCWDGNVDSLTDVDCANYMSVIRVIEATIHRDDAAAAQAGLRIDPIDGAKSYEEVERIVFANFLRFFRDTCSDYTRYGRANAKVFPHPVYSMCLEGCVETRRDTTDGGTRFRPRVMTLAFLANAVDSLCAIRKVVFEDRFCTLDEFLAAVRANWQGERAQAIRAEVLKAPCWGDNSPASNALMRKWIDTVADDLDGLTNDQGGPFVLACWIYREFLYWGQKTRATPDGRYDGERLAQGFAPSELRCKACVADVFNALSTVDHSRLFASNANLMFGGEGLTPELFAATFRVFARTGSHLLQPNCCDVETLRDAQRHPERHQNLMVKVCGFSARFIALSPQWQEEIISRHQLRLKSSRDYGVSKKVK